MGDPWRSPGRFVGLSERSGTGRGPLGRFGTGGETIGEDRDWSGSIEEVRDGSLNPRGGVGRVGGPLRRSGTVRRTLREVRDGLEDP